MRSTPIAAIAAALAFAAACSAPAPSQPVSQAPASQAAPARPTAFPPGTLVDLTHSFDNTTVFWPTADKFRLEKVADGVTPSGYYYAANNFFTAEHGGTHLDAPVHFSKGANDAAQVPLDRLFGAAVIVDVTAASEKDADYQVSVEDLQRAEKAQGPIPVDAILLIRTGFSKRWPDAAKYLGTAERGEKGVAQLHFPGLHPDAAKWLVANRRLKALGIDTASIDYGQSKEYGSHQVMYGNNIPGFENLTSLERLPLRGAFIVALPMKIGGGSGAPLRAVGILPG